MPTPLWDFWLPYLGACLGHGTLLVFCQNWIFGWPLPRRLLQVLRQINIPLILAGPLLLGLVFLGPYPLGRHFDVRPARGWELLPAGYLVLCWVTGLLAAPALQLRYWLRRAAARVVANHGEVVDVAAQLGYRPVGRGKRAAVARLPGNQLFQVEFLERTLLPSSLPPEWDGLTLLHLSDLHLCGTPDRVFYEHVMDRCRAWEPDLLALTGDFVDTTVHHRWLLPVLGRLRWRLGAFAILGNHDLWYEPERTRQGLRGLGIEVLGNGWAERTLRGRSLVVVGHEGPWFGPAPDLSACPAGDFRLLLSHTPDNLAWARRHGMDLMLAGHNHGGQIRLPVVGSVFVPCRSGRRYDCGTFYEPPTLLHVSRGLAGQQPVRYRCRPEVTLIRLARTAGAAIT